MKKFLQLTKEQQEDYNRFIYYRDKCRIVLTQNNYLSEHVPHSNVICSVDVVGIGHPLFEQNDLYLQYQEVFQNWLDVEPEFRHEERMRLSRGDYISESNDDNWDEVEERVEDLVQMVSKQGRS